MSVVVHFSQDLSEWLVRNLDGGQSPATLVQTMIEERMEPRVARGIVSAFLVARRTQGPPPIDSVVLEETGGDYAYEPSRLGTGSRIATFDREIQVVARGEKPSAAVLANVLARDECEQLIELARPRLRPSTVADPESGQDIVAGHRTSSGMFFRLDENAFIARLDRRFSELMNLPMENGEGIQILRYEPGGESTPHFDFLLDSNAPNRASIARSGQRVSTLVCYLSDVESGGETFFPRAGWSISPHRGNALYFEYCNSLGQVDEASLHAGRPVVAGEKWLATKWMRQRRFVSV